MPDNFLMINHFTATMNKNLSDHNFVLSDQDGVLVGHMSFQVKKIICSPANGMWNWMRLWASFAVEGIF